MSAGDYTSMTVYGCNCVYVTLCVVCAHVTVCVCPCDPVCDRKSVLGCVYPGLAIPSSPSLLEGRREMASMGEGASPLEVGEEMPAETASGNRGSIPSPGSCRDLPLYTQMSGAGWGTGPRSLPAEAKAETAQAEARPAQALNIWLGRQERRQPLPGEQTKALPAGGGGPAPGGSATSR